MKCEWVKQNVLLYVYGELPDDARYELEQHLTRCTDCTADLEATRNFHATVSETWWLLRVCGCRKRWKQPSRVDFGSA